MNDIIKNASVSMNLNLDAFQLGVLDKPLYIDFLMTLEAESGNKCVLNFDQTKVLRNLINESIKMVEE